MRDRPFGTIPDSFFHPSIALFVSPFFAAKGCCMKTLHTIVLASALSLSLSNAHATHQPHQSRFTPFSFFTNPELCQDIKKTCCFQSVGPVLTTIGAAGLVGLLLEKRGLINLIKLTAHSRQSAQKVFGVALVAGVIAWLWHEYKCCHDQELPQPYDFSC